MVVLSTAPPGEVSRGRPGRGRGRAATGAGGPSRVLADKPERMERMPADLGKVQAFVRAFADA